MSSKSRYAFVIAGIFLGLILWALNRGDAPPGANDVEVAASRPMGSAVSESAVAPVLEGAVAPEVDTVASHGDAAVAAEETDVQTPEIDLDALVEIEFTGPPSDVLETGACALELHVLDRLTQQPVATKLELWRLDAPASEHWSRGDQRQARAEVDASGVVEIQDLPPWTYRVRCEAARVGSEDPAPFLVRGSLSQVTVEIDLPRTLPVTVHVFDENGQRVVEARSRIGSQGSSFRGQTEAPRPSWVHQRECTTPYKPESTLGAFGVGGGVSGIRGPWTSRRDEGTGMQLVEVRERTWREASGWKQQFIDVDEGSRIDVSVRGNHPAPRTYAAVSLSRRFVAEHVLLPNGLPATDLAAHVSTQVEAVHCGDGDPRSVLAQCRVTVRCEHPDYRCSPVRFRYGDGVPTIHLRARMRR
ncbi:MAG: hypothetical protein AAF581_16250 [Planctomycetota bacterium]